MTHFLIYTEDKADSLQVRMDAREAHLEWALNHPTVKLISAGPWLDDAGDMRGSLLIVEGTDLQAVEAWLEDDPYNKAGLTGFKRVREFKWLLGAPT
jgi:uncharacterized protein YciI